MNMKIDTTISKGKELQAFISVQYIFNTQSNIGVNKT